MMNILVRMKSNENKNTYVRDLCDGTEGLRVINSMFLIEALCDKPSFVSGHSAIRFEFGFVCPFASEYVLIWTWWNKIPCTLQL